MGNIVGRVSETYVAPQTVASARLPMTGIRRAIGVAALAGHISASPRVYDQSAPRLLSALLRIACQSMKASLTFSPTCFTSPLGFESYGTVRTYLQIAGQWQDQAWAFEPPVRG